MQPKYMHRWARLTNERKRLSDLIIVLENSKAAPIISASWGPCPCVVPSLECGKEWGAVTCF